MQPTHHSPLYGTAPNGPRDFAAEIARLTALHRHSETGGPPFVARVGSVALASAVRVPIIPVGADCRPSLFERHKWDKALNPLPYGRIAVVCGEPLTFPSF